MIVSFNQIGRQPEPIFEGRVGDEVIVSGKGLSRKNDAYLDYLGNHFVISTSIHREHIKGKTVTQVSDIMLNSTRVGYVYPDIVETKKILFISVGYDCFNFNFNGADFVAFEVGLGFGKHYFCVYCEEELVAIIHKNDSKINFCDQYTIYAENDYDFLALCILTLYFDSINYADSGEITGEVYSDDSLLTTQKELIAKFDPSFIQKIIDRDRNVV